MKTLRNPFFLFGAYGVCLVLIALLQSVQLALGILGLGLISAIMALGINIQWGYAGLLNIGAMGFAAIGGATAVWVAADPVPAAWSVGGADLLLALFVVLGAVVIILVLNRVLPSSAFQKICTLAVGLLAFVIARPLFGSAVEAIEAVDPALSGYLGGLGAPILLSWMIGALVAAGAAWVIGKIALGLRADYLAIATLGIAEIVVAILKHEDWLTRGVKNVVGLPRPVPYEVDLVEMPWVLSLSNTLGTSADDMAAILVKLSYCALFGAVLLALLWLSEVALRAPWGRMMRAIRDNEVAARAMGKNVTKLHLRVFILGSAVVGMAGAMLVTLDGQFTPGTYQPLRFTFLIWIMVIIGGSGNNWGAILGGLVIWLFWVEAEPIGLALVSFVVAVLPEGSIIKEHILSNAAQMRLTLMGALLLLALRFAPGGLIPERRASN